MTRHVFHWQAPANHPALAGHFPNRPIVPGVVLLDQLNLFATENSGNLHALWQLTNAKFTETVCGGDSLIFILTEKQLNVFDFEIQRNAQTIAKGRLQRTNEPSSESST